MQYLISLSGFMSIQLQPEAAYSVSVGILVSWIHIDQMNSWYKIEIKYWIIG